MPAPPATLSPLDSERFGILVARAEGVTEEDVPALVSYCEEHRVELLVARCDGADVAAVRALSDAGLEMLEAQIAYRAPLAPARHPAVREGLPADRDAVAELARTGFGQHTGHYHADPRLPDQACTEGYVEWALRGLEGEAADGFFVAEVDGRPAAFAMFRQAGEEADFVLATIAATARGRGLYPALLHHAMDWAAGRGVKEMITVTAHDNLAPQRNLIKAGFLPAASTTTFHGWSDRLGLAR